MTEKRRWCHDCENYFIPVVRGSVPCGVNMEGLGFIIPDRHGENGGFTRKGCEDYKLREADQPGGRPILEQLDDDLDRLERMLEEEEDDGYQERCKSLCGEIRAVLGEIKKLGDQ